MDFRVEIELDFASWIHCWTSGVSFFLSNEDRRPELVSNSLFGKTVVTSKVEPQDCKVFDKLASCCRMTLNWFWMVVKSPEDVEY